MPLISSMLDTLTKDFPDIIFQESNEFRWSPEERVIFFIADEDPAFLLHEIAHAALKHTTYRRDIELIELERDAWSMATQILAPPYSVEITDDTIQDALDTYRDWLHARSTCPQCQSTGIQTAKQSYKCLACHAQWRVNEARNCHLRRYLSI